MSPFTYFTLALALLGSSLAAPTPEAPGTALEKRATFTGRGTFFDISGVGACHTVNKNTDFIVAVPNLAFAGGRSCGKTVTVVNKANKKSHTAIVRDQCPGCGASDLDMSPALFTAIGGTASVGTLSITWQLK